jgi:riboflavin biosynthesis pyrimidine reductase
MMEDRPFVICHMVASRDGRETGEFLESAEAQEAVERYYQLNREYAADAFACGRITMETSFTQGWEPDLSPFQGTAFPREDFVCHRDPATSRYAVAFDRRGRLGWQSSIIADSDPGYDQSVVIEVLCEDTEDARLAWFRHLGISYIFAGEHELDLLLALKKLKSLFGINTLLLEGGPILNASFKSADLIDQYSTVIAHC